MFLLGNFGQEVEEEQSFKPGVQCRGSVSGNAVIPALMRIDILVLRNFV
jgi:hypothetical protein